MVKVFLDGPTLEQLNSLEHPNIVVSGFTTNPSLVKKIGVTDYESFAKEVLRLTDKPVAFEVLSDDFGEMKRQAHKISSWGDNVNVKIPVTNTVGASSIPLIAELIQDGITVNVTAVTTFKQVLKLMPILYPSKSYLSVFAGRIADTGIDPVPMMTEIMAMLEGSRTELIWASAREVYNYVQADKINCNIITLGIDLLKKISYIGRDLEQVSLDTVNMFFEAGKDYIL